MRNSSLSIVFDFIAYERHLKIRLNLFRSDIGVDNFFVNRFTLWIMTACMFSECFKMLLTTGLIQSLAKLAAVSHCSGRAFCSVQLTYESP